MIQNHPLDLHPNNLRSLLMFMLALTNYALMYVANILLARSLTVDDFDDYSVALSIVTMLSTLATLGLENMPCVLSHCFVTGKTGQNFAASGYFHCGLSVASAYCWYLA